MSLTLNKDCGIQFVVSRELANLQMAKETIGTHSEKGL